MMKWNGTKFDRLADGTRMDEDRVTFMIEDSRSVAGFAKAGCYVACHDNMFNQEAKEHNLLAEGILDHWHWRGGRSGPMGYAEDAHVKNAATRQRDAAGTPPSAWIRGAGDRLREDQAALAGTDHNLAEGLPRFVFNKGKAMSGGFTIPSYFLSLADGSIATDPHLDLPQVQDVGANRSLLVVFQDRTFDTVDKVNAIDLGYLVFVTKDRTNQLPTHLQDRNGAAFAAWRDFWALELGIAGDPADAAARDAAEALLAAIHQEWESTDRKAMVTRSVGFIYPSDQHDITSKRSFDAEKGIWSVTLFRKLNTGSASDANLATLKDGTLFNLAFAMHDVGAGLNSHHISLPYTLGASSTTADILAASVADVKAVAWSEVPALLTRIFQPGEKTWEWLKDAGTHPGAGSVGTIRCQDCHKTGGLGPVLNP